MGTVGICRTQMQKCIIDHLLRLSTTDAGRTQTSLRCFHVMKFMCDHAVYI